jgi:hypothetical protein
VKFSGYCADKDGWTFGGSPVCAIDGSPPNAKWSVLFFEKSMLRQQFAPVARRSASWLQACSLGDGHRIGEFRLDTTSYATYTWSMTEAFQSGPYCRFPPRVLRGELKS